MRQRFGSVEVAVSSLLTTIADHDGKDDAMSDSAGIAKPVETRREQRLQWIDDDEAQVVPIEKAQTWLEELGERNEHGHERDDLNLMFHASSFSRTKREEEEGWL